MEKINRLKKKFKIDKIDGYIVPKNDEFFSEYISDEKDRLKYISNFSGSNGIALILRDKNILFIDGRYTLQASRESGNFFKINTIPNKLPRDILKNKNLKIGFDPKLFTKKTLNSFFGKTNCNYIPLNKNLIDKIWMRKESKIKNKFYILPNSSVGENYKSKINKVVVNMKKKKADFQFITASENNAWLLNIRGGDSKYTPIPYSYILIDKKKNINFFSDLKKIPSSFSKKFDKINFFDINSANKILSKIKKKNLL